MAETKTVKILSKDDGPIARTIKFSTLDISKLQLLGEDGHTVEYSCQGPDLFECLALLRKEFLEKRNWLVLCNGARRNVFPSRMARDMGAGRRAYVLSLGRQAHTKDLVDIFDAAEDVSSISSVEEQRRFYQEWQDSLRVWQNCGLPS